MRRGGCPRRVESRTVIDELHLQRFKGHRDTIVRLGRMTLLVGPNGSGKTSALEALDTLGRAASGSFPWQDPRPWYEAHVHRGDRGMTALGALGSVGGAPVKVTLSLAPIASMPGDVLQSLEWSDDAGSHGAKGGFPTDFPPSAGGRLVQGAVLLRPDATRIAAREGDGSMQVATGVAVDGEGNVIVSGRLDGRVDFDGVVVRHRRCRGLNCYPATDGAVARRYRGVVERERRWPVLDSRRHRARITHAATRRSCRAVHRCRRGSAPARARRGSAPRARGASVSARHDRVHRASRGPCRRPALHDRDPQR